MDSNPPSNHATKWHTPILDTNPETAMTAGHLKMDEHGIKVLLEVFFSGNWGGECSITFLYKIGGFNPI